jgi:excisionase family DNA binding protein
MTQRISYSVHEAANAVGIGLTKLREEIRAKRLVARKLGRRTLITVEDLNAWAAKLPKVNSSQAA